MILGADILCRGWGRGRKTQKRKKPTGKIGSSTVPGTKYMLNM